MSFRDLWTRVFVEPVDGGAAAELAALHGGVFPRAWSEDEFATLLSATDVSALGVRLLPWVGRPGLVGFVLIRAAGDEAEILTIVVRRQYQGRGYGRMLMEECLRRLYHDRTGSCFLEVEPANAVAVGLYRSLGFVPAGERNGDYRDLASALVMRLDLSVGAHDAEPAAGENRK